MVNNDPFFQSEIVFTPDTHQYFNLKKEEYKSVSRALKGIQVPFDKQRMSGIMACKIAEDTGVTIEQAQKELLTEWDQKKDSSIDKGDYIHDSMERYAIKGTYDDEMKDAVLLLMSILKEHYRYFPEVLIHSHTYKMAGRTDLALIRQKSKNPIIDFIDYKSNQSKRIQFDSVGRKTIPIRHYNRYLLPPFDYLEDCNYTTYSLQLSIYAFMAMERLGIRVGMLGILFIDNNFKPSLIPVPFMYHEAKIICEMNITHKELPEVVINGASATDIVEFSKPVNTSFNPKEVKEDW